MTARSLSLNKKMVTMTRLGKKLVASGLACVAAASLAACGGGGHGASAVPALTTPGDTGGGAAATLRITIPAAGTQAASVRRAPRYIASTTKSVAISFVPTTAGPTQTFNQNLTPSTNPNCAGGSGNPIVCTLTLYVTAGSYTANFTTYDGALDGTGNPTGNKLSATQNVAVTIVKNQANVINVVFGGLPTQVAFVPAATSALRTAGATQYQLSTCATGSHDVTVTGLDADGNTILGAGAPVPALTATTGASAVSIAAPAAGTPNTFTFTTQPGVTAGTTVTFVPKVTPPADSGGSAVSGSVTLTYDSNLCGPAVDFASTPTAFNATAVAITAGPDSAMWFTESVGGASYINRMTTAGAITNTYTIPTASANPRGIALGPDNNLWFTEADANKIGRVTTAGVFTEFALASGSHPDQITAGPDGALWFTEGSSNKIGRIPTTATVATPGITEFAIPTASSNPLGITAGPDGALWFTEATVNKIGRIPTTATVGSPGITEYATPGSFPYGIAAGADGNLWFIELATNKVARIATTATVATPGIVEFAIPTSSSQPLFITKGPDGAMWFTEQIGNKIGRIPPSATTATPGITEFTVPTANSSPQGIAAGPDGAIWFTEYFGNRIGQIK